jgi:hypothetical protein
MGGLHHVSREANFEAKDSDESPNGIGSRWGPLSLAGGASGAAVGPARDTPTENTAPVITFGSAWRLSMSSTMKTLEHILPAYNLPKDAATEAAEAAQSIEAAEAAQ